MERLSIAADYNHLNSELTISSYIKGVVRLYNNKNELIFTIYLDSGRIFKQYFRINLNVFKIKTFKFFKNGKMRKKPLTTEIIELSTAENILINIYKSIDVSRHTVLRNKKAIRLYLQYNQYRHLKNEVEDIIQDAILSA